MFHGSENILENVRQKEQKECKFRVNPERTIKLRSSELPESIKHKITDQVFSPTSRNVSKMFSRVAKFSRVRKNFLVLKNTHFRGISLPREIDSNAVSFSGIFWDRERFLKTVCRRG
jgi:hypothetical protein